MATYNQYQKRSSYFKVNEVGLGRPGELSYPITSNNMVEGRGRFFSGQKATLARSPTPFPDHPGPGFVRKCIFPILQKKGHVWAGPKELRGYRKQEVSNEADHANDGETTLTKNMSW